MTEHHKIRGIFWERMELNHFPYDVQELSLSLTTPLTSKDLYFSPNKQKPSGVNRTVFSDQQSWYLYEHVEFNYEQHREEYSLNFNQIHPVVVCTCHVGRKCGYYIWYVDEYLSLSIEKDLRGNIICLGMPIFLSFL